MRANNCGSKTYMIAESLVRSGALKFGNFTLKSGIKSPYYIDLTWLLSSPKDFEQVSNVIADEIGKIISERAIDKLATIELKGALILPHVASILKIPCIVIRKESKSYGITGRIVGGEVRRGERLIFFDDVITDGRSKLKGIRPIEEMGGIIDTILVLVDREQGGKENLESIGYRVRVITTISEIVSSLLEKGRILQEDARKILEYMKGEKASP